MALAAAAAQRSTAADYGLLPFCGAGQRRIIQDVGGLGQRAAAEEAPLAGSMAITPTSRFLTGLDDLQCRPEARPPSVAHNWVTGPRPPAGARSGRRRRAPRGQSTGRHPPEPARHNGLVRK